MKNKLLIIFLIIFLCATTFYLCSCENYKKDNPAGIAKFSIEIINRIPHAKTSFTQGLFYHQGYLYESTGLYKQSSLQKLNARTGKIEKRIPMDASVFAEGLTLHQGRLYQLTWKEKKAFVYDLETFALLNTFAYDTDGWGLTSDGEHLIMSDGSHVLYFRDARTFDIKKNLFVKKYGQPLNYLNELEYVNGYIYANIYQTDFIAMIDSGSGNVTGMIDASSLYQHLQRSPKMDVLNGIAYNPESGYFYITGKNWPIIFEVRFIRSTN
jgi:glutamine cyclotransferase